MNVEMIDFALGLHERLGAFSVTPSMVGAGPSAELRETALRAKVAQLEEENALLKKRLAVAEEERFGGYLRFYNCNHSNR